MVKEGRKLIQVDPKEGSLMANGTKYYVESALSVDRWKVKDAIEIELGLGVSFNETFTKLKEVYELLNKMRLADATVKIYDLMNGLSNLEKRHVPILMYCTLFINAEDEDRRYWSIDLANKKIKDWNEEGIDMSFFLTIAFSALKGLKELYLKTSQGSSEEKKS